MKKLIYLIVILSITSCTKEVKFNGDEIEARLVMNGIFDVDSLATISLTQSKHILEEPGNYETVANAELILENKTDNTTEQLMYIGNSNYRTVSMRTEAGKEYRVTASKNNFTTATATQQMPLSTSIISVDTLRANHETQQYLDLQISFKDNGSTTDYYEIKLIGSQWQYTYDKVTFEIDSELVTNVPIYFQVFDPVYGDTKGWYSESLLITDEYFSGRNTRVEVSVDTWEAANNPEIIVQLSKVTIDYYLYFTSNNKQSESKGNAFAEPAPVYANTSNGVGFLGAIAPSRYTVLLK